MIRPGVKSVRWIAASPIGPAPTTATESPGLTRPLRTPTSYDGREDVGQEQHLLVGQLGAEPCRPTCRRTESSVLRLNAVDGVAEDPTASAGAEPIVAFAAVRAAAAGGDAGGENAISEPTS